MYSFASWSCSVRNVDGLRFEVFHISLLHVYGDAIRHILVQGVRQQVAGGRRLRHRLLLSGGRGLATSWWLRQRWSFAILSELVLLPRFFFSGLRRVDDNAAPTSP